jgi:hypothetical protein
MFLHLNGDEIKIPATAPLQRGRNQSLLLYWPIKCLTNEGIALPSVVGSIVLYQNRESHCVHCILVSGLPVSSCNDLPAGRQVADCNLLVDLWSKNHNELHQL